MAPGARGGRGPAAAAKGAGGGGGGTSNGTSTAAGAEERSGTQLRWRAGLLRLQVAGKGALQGAGGGGGGGQVRAQQVHPQQALQRGEHKHHGAKEAGYLSEGKGVSHVALAAGGGGGIHPARPGGADEESGARGAVLRFSILFLSPLSPYDREKNGHCMQPHCCGSRGPRSVPLPRPL